MVKRSVVIGVFRHAEFRFELYFELPLLIKSKFWSLFSPSIWQFCQMFSKTQSFWVKLSCLNFRNIRIIVYYDLYLCPAYSYFEISSNKPELTSNVSVNCNMIFSSILAIFKSWHVLWIRKAGLPIVVFLSFLVRLYL